MGTNYNPQTGTDVATSLEQTVIDGFIVFSSHSMPYLMENQNKGFCHQGFVYYDKMTDWVTLTTAQETFVYHRTESHQVDENLDGDDNNALSESFCYKMAD